jgi:hypothetical protein
MEETYRRVENRSHGWNRVGSLGAVTNLFVKTLNNYKFLKINTFQNCALETPENNAFKI